MKQRYAFLLPVLGAFLLQSTSSFGQCLGNFSTPPGQTNLGAAFTAVSVPPSTTITLNLTTTIGSNLATIASCNAALITNNAGVNGPSVPGGTFISGGACGANTVQLSQNATVTGTTPHTFVMPAWALPYPPTNPGIPSTLNCSVCPAVFTANICAGQYFSYYMCQGNAYSISLCGAAALWDSEITLTTTTGTVLATGFPTFDDDGCGTANGHADITFIPTASNTYRVRVFGPGCTVNGGLCGAIQVACNPVPAPPTNDEPAGAISLGSPVSTVCTMSPGTNSFATQSAGTPTNCLAGGCGTNAGPFSGYDVWYSAGVPASGNLSVILNGVGASNLAMAIYNSSLVQVGGTSCGCTNFLTLSGLTPGSYYIRVWTTNGLQSMGTFQICAYEPIPPPNDNPCGAIVLPVGAGCAFTSFTTESATPLQANMTANGPSCGTPVAGGDVWFRVTMPPSGSMTINTQAGSLTDMAMTVYQLTAGGICGPGTLTEVAGSCNNDFGASTMPRTQISGAWNNVYYVRMWNRTAAFGTASICAFENFPPPNDTPCNPYALPVNTGCLFPAPYTTENATLSNLASSPGVITLPTTPTCGTPVTNDVWFTAVIPPSGQLQLDTDDGQLTDAAFAVYTATGSCGGNNLALTQVAAINGGCQTAGSTNSPGPTYPMPITTITGVAPGTTVYIRVWRQNGNEGTFQICARNPQNPVGCYYTLRMSDSAGDGWNGGYVTVCVGAACTNYTVYGSLANITFGAALGQNVTVSYTPVGGFQNQVSYSLQASNGFNMFSSSNPPLNGFNYAFTVNASCNVPPAPVEDCLGAFEVCNSQNFLYPPSNFGNTQDLNASNRGCMLSNERQGVWLRFTTNAAGTIAFTINIGVGTDYDFAVWGPPGSSTCPPTGPPLRCNWSGTTGPTGLNYTSVSPSQGASGPPFSQWITAAANQTFLLYVDNFTMNGLAFNLAWNNVPTNILDCILPVEFMTFEAFPKARQVDLKWTTATESNSGYFKVERSSDGQGFEAIGTVNAMGSSQVLTEYGFVDPAPRKGMNYYRLDQVDGNGSREYSKVVTALYRYGSLPLQVYPNPAGESIWASFELPEEGNVRWRVLDASGRVVRDGFSMVSAGMNQMEVKLERVEAGSYMLEIMDGSGTTLGNARFVRQ